jgi:hypothetical protein
LASTEAWNYLCQFHHPADDAATLMTRRPGFGHRSSASLSALAAPPMGGGGGYGYGMMPPSLTHTPTTAASSLNSNSDYIGYMYDPSSLGGAGTTANTTRPLPPRHNPSFSTGAGATKGVELVVPHIVQAPTPAVAAAPSAAIVGGTSPPESCDGGIWLKSRGNSAKPLVEVVHVSRKAH